MDSSRSNSPYRSQASLDPYGGYLMNQRPISIVDNSNTSIILDEPEYASDHSEGSHMSRRRSSMTPNSRANKDKKAVEVIDMELLKGKIYFALIYYFAAY
jgi:hypothetical protein